MNASGARQARDSVLMLQPREISWWYWLATSALLVAWVAGLPQASWFVLGLSLIQLAHFWAREGSLAAFPVQVRLAYVGVIALAAGDPTRLLVWVPTVGTLAQVVFGYCALARTLSLLPWNRRESLSFLSVLRTYAARPRRGSILQGQPASRQSRPAPGRSCAKPNRNEPNGAMPLSHVGSCFCGAVQIEVEGSPEGMGYCHCSSCRKWSGGPVNAFTLWKPEAVRVTAGADQVATFQKTPLSERKYCAKCGGHLMTNHPPLGLVDVFASTIPSLPFQPGVHVNYAETVLPMRDGLPKLKDFPAELGGSGEAVPE